MLTCVNSTGTRLPKKIWNLVWEQNKATGKLRNFSPTKIAEGPCIRMETRSTPAACTFNLLPGTPTLARFNIHISDFQYHALSVPFFVGNDFNDHNYGGWGGERLVVVLCMRPLSPAFYNNKLGKHCQIIFFLANLLSLENLEINNRVAKSIKN